MDKIIEDIETVLDCGFKMPGLGVLVPTKEIRKYIEMLKKTVNEAVEEAEHIVNIRERILAEAKKEAEEIIKRHQMEIAKQPIIKEAELKAKKMLYEARAEANRMIAEAEDFQNTVKERIARYADMIFEELEREISESKKKISKNRMDMKAFVNEINRKEFEVRMNRKLS